MRKYSLHRAGGVSIASTESGAINTYQLVPSGVLADIPQNHEEIETHLLSEVPS